MIKFSFAFSLLVLIIHSAFCQNPALVVPIGHSGQIDYMKLSKDGSLLFTGDNKGEFKTWDTKTAREINSLKVFPYSYDGVDRISYSVSSKGEYLLVSTNITAKTRLFDLSKNLKITEFENKRIPVALFSPDDKYIYIENSDGIILSNVGDKTKNQNVFILNKTTGEDRNLMIDKPIFSENGKYLAIFFRTTISSDSHFILVWNIKENKEAFRIPVADFHSNFEFNIKEDELLISENNHLKIWDLVDGKYKQDISDFGKFGYSISFSGYQKNNSNLYYFNDLSRLGLYEILTGKTTDLNTNFVGQSMLNITSYVLDKNKNILYQAASNPTLQGIDGIWRSLDIDKGLEISRFENSINAPIDQSYVKRKNKLLTIHKGKIGIMWDFTNFNVSPFNGDFSSKQYPGTNWLDIVPFNNIDSLFLVKESSSIITFDKELNRIKSTPSITGEMMVFNKNDSLLAIANNQTIEIFPFDESTEYYFHSKRKLSGHLSYIKSFDFINDSLLISTDEFDAIIWNIHSGQIINRIKFDGGFINDMVIFKDNFILAGSNGKLKIINSHGETLTELEIDNVDHKKLAINDSNNYLVTSDIDNTVKLWDISDIHSIKHVHDFLGHKDEIISLGFFPDNKFIISISKDMTVKLWDIHKRKLLVTLLSFGNDWLIVDDEGYYMGSKNGSRNVHFVLNNHVYLFNQFDPYFNRPDIILRKLGYATEKTLEIYRNIWLKRIERLDLDPNLMTPEFITYNIPEVKIQSSEIIKEDSGNYALIKAEFSDSENFLKKVNISVNGVQLANLKGMNFDKLNLKSIHSEFKIPLTEGKNTITLSVLNSSGVESLNELLDIVNDDFSFNKKILHVVSIGVSEYSEEKLNLYFASKDAKDVLNYFSMRNSRDDVKSYTLLDNQVTKESITSLLEELKDINPNDELIFFYAGHGFIDENYKFYLATHYTNMNDPFKNSIPFESIESIFNEIPSRQKVMFLDACYSGEIDENSLSEVENLVVPEFGKVEFSRSIPNSDRNKSVVGMQNIFDLMKETFADISNSSGSTIISAARGSDFAFESSSINNGLFTYSLLEGLKGDADFNRDGKILISEIQNYLNIQVPLLSQNLQKPTTRNENLIVDFEL